MRWIKKIEGNEFFKNKKVPTSAIEAQKGWSALKPGRKKKLREILLDEQLHLCGYTEVNPKEYQFGIHIEHIAPKGRFPEKTFDYQNLIVSVLAPEDFSRIDPNTGEKYSFGGHSKGNEYDDGKFISCLDKNCESFFAYGSDGRISPRKELDAADKAKAVYTINVLKLNCSTLIFYRKKFVENLDQEFTEWLDIGLPVQDLSEIYLKPDKGVLKSFYSISRQRLPPIK
jgi:uncharacterized protein (TIGR02646 family)